MNYSNLCWSPESISDCMTLIKSMYCFPIFCCFRNLVVSETQRPRLLDTLTRGVELLVWKPKGTLDRCGNGWGPVGIDSITILWTAIGKRKQILRGWRCVALIRRWVEYRWPRSRTWWNPRERKTWESWGNARGRGLKLQLLQGQMRARILRQLHDESQRQHWWALFASLSQHWLWERWALILLRCLKWAGYHELWTDGHIATCTNV